MRLRQIALVATDLAAARADISAVLGVQYAFDAPAVGKYGLRNAVFPIGDTFLEVVSPKESGTTAGRLLEKRGGDGGYMVILQVDDLAQALARVKNAAARIADQSDKDGAAFMHIHPKDIGGAMLSLDRMAPKVRGPDLHAKDPAQMAARWAQLLGRAATLDAGVWSIRLDDGEIRFTLERDGRGEGLGAFDVIVRDVDAVEANAAARGLLAPDGAVVLAGTRVRLIQ